MSEQKTISFRMDTGKVEALDEIAVQLRRDRTFLLNEAVDAWLDLHEYQRQLVDAGRQAAEEGRYLHNAEMRQRLAVLKKRTSKA
jgi:predicted transcriptional regulator